MIDLESLAETDESLDLALDAIERQRCEDSLIEFSKRAWLELESGRMIINWHHIAIAETLEDIVDQKMRNLVVNIPPRTTKTLLSSVFFPAWVWAQPEDRWGPLCGPKVRFLCISYGAELAGDIAVKMRRLVQGEWYQRLWGDRVRILEDQKSRENFANAAGGERMSYSIEGGILGRGGDCLTGDTIVTTPAGPKRIGEIDISASPKYILSYDKDIRAPTYRRVIAVARRASSPIWRIRTRSGNVVEATGEHRVHTARGFIPVVALAVGDVLLRAVPQAGRASGERIGEESTQARGRTVLQCPMRLHREQQTRRPNPVVVPRMRQEVATQETERRGAVQRGMSAPGFCPPRSRTPDYRGSIVRGLWDEISAEDKKNAGTILLAGMQESSAFGGDEGARQSGISARPGGNDPRWLQCEMAGDQDQDFESGRLAVHGLRSAEQASASASHRSGPDQQRQRESDQPLRELPSQISQYGEIEVECDYVSVVEPTGKKEIVYDLQVEETETFFANGILVHNCQILDDPNGIKDKNSAATREATLDGMRQLVTRVTDPRTTARILVQQRVHEDDATNFALDQWTNVTHLMFPARYDAKAGEAVPEDPRTEEGELLWPEVWGENEVKAEEDALGPIDSAGQLQQRPVPRHGAIVQRSGFKCWPDDEPGADERSMYFCAGCRWSGAIEAYAQILCPSCGGTATRQVPYPPFILRVLSVDTAYGENQDNSFSAATRWGIWLGRDNSPRAMLCAAWRGRPRLFGNRGEPGLVDHIHTMATRPNQECDFLVIERKTRGVDLYHELERLSARWPYQLVYFEPKGRGDKVVRLQACTGMFTQSLVWAPNKAWADLVINETVSYPRGKYTDLTDTLVQFLLWGRDNGYLLYGAEHRIEEARKKVFTKARRRVSEMIEGV